MKCIGAEDPPCRRCRKTGSLCEFVPRANAAISLDSPVNSAFPANACSESWRGDIARRVKDTEDRINYLLSIASDQSLKFIDSTTSPTDTTTPPIPFDHNDPFSGMLVAVEKVRLDQDKDRRTGQAWDRGILVSLWSR